MPFWINIVKSQVRVLVQKKLPYRHAIAATIPNRNRRLAYAAASKKFPSELRSFDSWFAGQLMGSNSPTKTRFFFG